MCTLREQVEPGEVCREAYQSERSRLGERVTFFTTALRLPHRGESGGNSHLGGLEMAWPGLQRGQPRGPGVSASRRAGSAGQAAVRDPRQMHHLHVRMGWGARAFGDLLAAPGQQVGFRDSVGLGEHVVTLQAGWSQDP